MKIFTAIFPLILVMLVFTLFNRKDLKKGPVLDFLLIAVVVILLGRIAIFYAGVKIATRYFYGITVIAICFAAPGVVFLSDIFKKIINRQYPSFTKQNAIGIILLLCASICLGKALRFKSNSKMWIYETADTIKAYTKSTDKPVLISNNPDQRAAYYGDAVFVKFIESTDKTIPLVINETVRNVSPEFGMLANAGKNEYVGRWILLEGSTGLTDLKESLNKLDGKVFVLMRMEDRTFRQKFTEAGIPFPLKLIKTIHDDKKREICIYLLKD